MIGQYTKKYQALLPLCTTDLYSSFQYQGKANDIHTHPNIYPFPNLDKNINLECKEYHAYLKTIKNKSIDTIETYNCMHRVISAIEYLSQELINKRAIDLNVLKNVQKMTLRPDNANDIEKPFGHSGFRKSCEEMDENIAICTPLTRRYTAQGDQHLSNWAWGLTEKFSERVATLEKEEDQACLHLLNELYKKLAEEKMDNVKVVSNALINNKFITEEEWKDATNKKSPAYKKQLLQSIIDQYSNKISNYKELKVCLFGSKLEKYVNQRLKDFFELKQPSLLDLSELIINLHAVHPFCDGNGRTICIALVNSLLIHMGYTPAIQYDTGMYVGLSSEQVANELLFASLAGREYMELADEKSKQCFLICYGFIFKNSPCGLSNMDERRMNIILKEISRNPSEFHSNLLKTFSESKGNLFKANTCLETFIENLISKKENKDSSEMSFTGINSELTILEKEPDEEVKEEHDEEYSDFLKKIDSFKKEGKIIEGRRAIKTLLLNFDKKSLIEKDKIVGILEDLWKNNLILAFLNDEIAKELLSIFLFEKSSFQIMRCNDEKNMQLTEEDKEAIIAGKKFIILKKIKENKYFLVESDGKKGVLKTPINNKERDEIRFMFLFEDEKNTLIEIERF